MGLIIALGGLLMLSLAAIAQEKVVKESVRGKLVDGFPSIPMYPGAVVEESQKIVQGDKTGFEADLVSKDPVFEVYSYYLQALKREDWDISFASSNSPTASEQGIGAVKKNLRIYIDFEQEGRQTEIEIEIPLQTGLPDDE